MNAQLLTTKLYIPPLRFGHVSREHLVEKINAGTDGKLTLISAPAGFGKTSLVSEWVNQGHRPTAWVSLDENDNDLRRFLAYFIASLQSIDVDVDALLPENHPTTQNTEIEDLLIPVINQIANTGFEFSLVLDDYHLIQSQDVHDAVTFILDNLPPLMHLIIASRADPPLPLARLRARGQLTEIRAANLGFSLEDGGKYLNQVLSTRLSQESVQTLIARTDGWIAAIQMVAIAIQGKSQADDYVQGVSGNQNYIADFLTTEVIQQQPGDIQDFLLKTSLLDRLSGPLCEALTGRDDSQNILQQLRDANLFILPLDDQNEWFRYHRLFADLLQQRLNQSQPEFIPTLYLKASEWFEVHQFQTDAIDYALRGSHMKRAAKLIDSAAAETLMRSEIATFLRWVEKLPERVICGRPALCINYAWALLISSGKNQTAEKFLKRVETDNVQLNGRLKAVQSMVAVYNRRVPEALELAQQAMDQIHEEDHFYRHIASWNLSAMLFISGDRIGGIKMLEESARISLVSNNRLVAIVALSRLGSYYLQQGELDRAKDYYEQALAVKPDNQTRPLPAACEAMLGLGKLAWERYELDLARQHIHNSLELSTRWRKFNDVDSYVILAHISQSLGDFERAHHHILRAKEIARQTTTMETDDNFVASQAALLSLRQGDLSAVKRWAAARELETISLSWEFDELQLAGTEVVLRYELIVFARYLLATNRTVEALSLLGKLLPSMVKLEHRVKEFEIQILYSLGLHAQRKVDVAVTMIGKVINLAEGAEFKRIFLDEGPPMVQLINALIKKDSACQFAKQLLDIFPGQPEKSLQPSILPTWVDPLSEREIEVLRLLVSELPVPEIAVEIHIAVSTLRTHIKNIYSKLGVHSRFEAVSKGRDLGLI